LAASLFILGTIPPKPVVLPAVPTIDLDAEARRSLASYTTDLYYQLHS